MINHLDYATGVKDASGINKVEQGVIKLSLLYKPSDDLTIVPSLWMQRVLSKDSRIVGDKAIYDLDKGSAVITGKNLKATSKDSYVTARDSLEYWTKEGAVVARGDGVAADPTRHIQKGPLFPYPIDAALFCRVCKSAIAVGTDCPPQLSRAYNRSVFGEVFWTSATF